MNLLLEAVVLRASEAALLATVVTSGEGPFNKDLKKLGQQFARSSLRLVWSLLSHLVHTLCLTWVVHIHPWLLCSSNWSIVLLVHYQGVWACHPISLHSTVLWLQAHPMGPQKRVTLVPPDSTLWRPPSLYWCQHPLCHLHEIHALDVLPVLHRELSAT